MSEVRVPFIINEPLVEGYPNVRVPFVINEPLTEGVPNARVSFVINEPLVEGYPNVRIALVTLEALVPIPEELPMSTAPFPGFGNSQSDPSVPAGANPANTSLPGLTFSVYKRPTFKTNIKEAPSGREVRNSLTQYPRWEFTLTYEFLEDSTGADSSLKSIMGFFLARQGSFDSWLFKDPDDYLVENGPCGNTDGLTTQFPFVRTIGEYGEKVGQVDTVNTINVYLSVTDATTVPGTGPYTRTVTHAADFVEDLGVVKDGTTPMTKVTGTPTTGQYAVDTLTGIYTFAAADAGDTLAINYRYLVDPADYTVTLPNLIVFDSAPPVGSVSADFQFFFACRFVEDQIEFEKFYDKLWSLQECTFRSIIQ